MTKTTRHQTTAAISDIQTDLQSLTRRRLLKTGLWLGAGLTTAFAGGFVWLRRSPLDQRPAPEGLVHLQPAHYHLFNRLAEVLLPTEGTPLLPVAQVPVARRVDQLLAGIEAGARGQLLIGLSLFDNLAVLSGGHGGRFVDLPDAAAVAYIDRWMNSGLFPLRAIANAAGRLAKTAYWSDPQTWPAIGFTGPVTRPRGIASLGNAPLPTT